MPRLSRARLPAAARGVLHVVPLLLYLILGGRSSIDRAATRDGSGELHHALAGAGIGRLVPPRLSIPTRYEACRATPGTEGSPPRTECGGASSQGPDWSRITAVAERASAGVLASMDPDALHAAALLDLLWADEKGILLDRSISYLQSVARLRLNDVAVLTDLVAAHLVRAERRQTPRDLVEALELAEHAAELAPFDGAVLFNRALTLEQLGLHEQAIDAWGRLLAVDSTSGWAAEARDQVRALSSRRAEDEASLAHDAGDDPVRHALLAPQAGRLHGWSRLGAWGEAILQGDPTTAEANLALAEAIGAALERRGGDRTLADAARAIRSAALDPAVLPRLASAHHSYALGEARYLQGRRSEAERHFAEAARFPVRSPAAQWATAFRAASLVYLRDEGGPERGEEMLRLLLLEVNAARYPALAGRVHWMLGTTVARRGRYEEALTLYGRAAEHFAHAGEREHLGAVQALAAEIRFRLGEFAGGYAAMHEALRTLRPYRSSTWLHNLLYISAEAAEGEGMVRAALRFQDEGLGVAAGARPAYLVEAHLVRARLQRSAGRMDAAAADLAVGRALLADLDSEARTWLAADMRTAEAAILAGPDPRRAATALDSVVSFFETGASAGRLLQALLQRSEARAGSGDADGAAADLERVVALLEEQRATLPSESRRAALIYAAKGVFERIVMLHVNSGRPREALEYLERARASTVSRNMPSEPASRFEIPAGETAVALSLIGDTLLAWTVSQGGLHLTRATVDREELLRQVERARSALELGASEQAAAPALTALFDLLIRPLASRLGPRDAALILIADGELGDVPFPALLDSRSGRYLVEDHVLRIAASLRDARRRISRGTLARSGILLVADPAFDPASHPGLQRLAGAAAEAEAVAGLYPAASVLRGERADRATVLEALSRSGILHYAGHAVFDDGRPERSYLALASSGAGDGGRLLASEIERLDLDGLRLVVLSACETLRGRKGNAGGFVGLSRALLAAGADGVVGSLWKVQDDRTQTLMVEFHRAHRDSGDGARALREAQLRLLRSGIPTLRAPATWAAFRFAGR
jgi:CHAT domain-containing protein